MYLNYLTVDLTDGSLAVIHEATVAGSFDIVITAPDISGATAETTVTVTISYFDATVTATDNMLSVATRWKCLPMVQRWF